MPKRSYNQIRKLAITIPLVASLSMMDASAYAGVHPSDLLPPLAKPTAHSLSITVNAPDTPLQLAWQSALRNNQLKNATVSAYAYDLTTHTPLADIHGQWQLTPASVMKLFTSAAALSVLGTQFHYHTSVRFQSIQHGSIPGPLYLQGGGDPWLEANGAQDLEHLAQQVALQVHSATQVIGVSTLYAGASSGTGWTWDDLPWNYTPAISALTSERDQLNLYVAAGAPGQPPTVTINPDNPSIDPGPPFLQIINHAITVNTNQSSTLSVNRTPGSNTILLTGQIPAGEHDNLFFSLHDPALLTATLFQKLLQTDGVHFTASPSTGLLPPGTKQLTGHNSPPLSDYLQIQNTYSINTMAENLYHMLGTHDGGDGSAAASAAAISAWKHAAGLSVSTVQVDGSGLSPLDEVSAQNVVNLLKYAATQPWFTVFEHSLIHIGRTDQCSFLCGLMDQTAADGHVWIKTGNLGNQWNYAGYARAQNGDHIAFAVLIDGLTDQFYQQAVGTQDQMTVDAASWPHESSVPSALTLANGISASTAVQQLPSFLTSLSIPGGTGSLLSGDLVNLRTGQSIWSLHANTRMEPALLPRLALLSAYFTHPSSDFGSVSLASSGTLHSGLLSSSLLLNGHGAVNLSTADALYLARQLKNKGIRRIQGGVDYLSDAQLTPANDLPVSLPWEDFGQSFAPAVSNLAFDEGVVHVTVVPSEPGHPAHFLQLDPAAQISLVNETTTGQTHSSTTLQATWVRDTSTYVITGSIPFQSTPVFLSMSAPHTGLTAAYALQSALAKFGISVSAPPKPQVAVGAATTVLTRLPTEADQTITQQLLFDPSTALPLALLHALGQDGMQQVQSAAGNTSEVAEPTGLGLENYMTASDTAQILLHFSNTKTLEPLANTLSHDGLWSTTGPEQWALAGYIRVNGQECALALLVNGLPWDGAFLPTISWNTALG